MKTLGYVLGEFPVLSETFVGTEMRAMLAQGYKVAPFAFQHHGQQGQPADAELSKKTQSISQAPFCGGVLIWCKHPKKAWQALKFIMLQTGLPKRSLFRTTGQLAWLAQSQKCEHLHAHFALHTASTAIAAAKLSGMSVSFVGHGFDVYAQPADLALKLSYADFSVAVCDDMQADFLRASPKAKVHRIDCGIELQRYPFQPQKNHNGKLLFVGRLTEKKGLSDLLLALSQLQRNQRPTLDIVGDGELQSALQNQVRQLKLDESVNFIGSRTSEWLVKHAASYLSLCAPFCMAENGDRDTGPLVVKESMALGLPVICSYFMGCKKILSKETGHWVRPNQPADIVRAICQVQALPNHERLNLVTRARDRLETHFASNLSGLKLSFALKGIEE